MPPILQVSENTKRSPSATPTLTKGSQILGPGSDPLPSLSKISILAGGHWIRESKNALFPQCRRGLGYHGTVSNFLLKKSMVPSSRQSEPL